MPTASRNHPRVKQLRAAFASHARLSGGLIAIEGEHLLIEAMHAGLTFETVFLSTRIEAAPAWLAPTVELLRLTPEVFASVADTQTPQGIAALVTPPTWTLGDLLPAHPAPLVLIAAGLQDPGNLGTLIRSAHAFAATGVLTLPGTVSPWNQKAIRASAGSVFRIPTIALSSIADLAELKRRGIHLYAAVADSDGPGTKAPAIPVSAANLTQPCALIIGNEGAGIPADILALADTRLTIPTPGRVESLNAAIAGSLLLYEASRQRSHALTTTH
jgi:TrmH family RNA methyltransferase